MTASLNPTRKVEGQGEVRVAADENTILIMNHSHGVLSHVQTGFVCFDGERLPPAAWSPGGNWSSFRFTDETHWRNKARTARVYADKRSVWIVRPDGREPHVIECLRFQCAIDGSRASWKPR